MNGNEESLGRNWSTADRATLHDFGDCFRAHIYWDDGAEAYTLHDTREAALSDLARWGFRPHRVNTYELSDGLIVSHIEG